VNGAHLRGPAGGFPAGRTVITRCDNADGLGLGVLRLRAGERHEETLQRETALLLMQGTVAVSAGSISAQARRESLFDAGPSCLHAAAGTRVVLNATSDCEFTVYETPNTAQFAARWFAPADVGDEHRGHGQVRNRSLRIVRTIFDGRNSPPEATLVLGEVITLPGGWSSYPPHHHPQPEIYHYRFTAPQGFGHAELGEQVFKVRQYDTVRIAAGHDHAQCAAPGYGMYYAWVIRHLPDCPYTVPEFTAEHAWTMQPDASFWWPDGIGDEHQDA